MNLTQIKKTISPISISLPVLAICVLIIVVIWPLLFFQDTIMEDALITARYAYNLAVGNGLVYNPGERVLGTTTPAWAFITSWIFFIPASKLFQVTLIQLLSTLFIVAAIWKLSQIPVFNYPKSRATFILILSIAPVVASTARMGMETAIVIWLSIMLWSSLAYGNDQVLARFTRSGFIYLLLLLRLDTLLIIFSIYSALLLIESRCKRVFTELVALATTLVVFAASWSLVTYVYFGQIIPQSMVAKTRLNYADSSIWLPLDVWWSNILQLLGLNYPWPTILAPLPVNNLMAMAWISVFLLIGWKCRNDRTISFLMLTSIIFLIIYAGFFTIGQASVFPWYSHVPSFLMLSSVLVGVIVLFQDQGLGSVICLRHPIKANAISGAFQKKHLSPMLIAILFMLIVAGQLSMHALIVRGLLMRGSSEHTVLRLTGEYLYELRAQSVMLEPIGYIGFYSQTPKVYDLAGLVSPDIFEFRRTGSAGWFTDAVTAHKPEYVVLRADEIKTNMGWNIGILFNSTEQKLWWNQNYQLLITIGEGESKLDRISIYAHNFNQK